MPSGSSARQQFNYLVLSEEGLFLLELWQDVMPDDITGQQRPHAQVLQHLAHAGLDQVVTLIKQGGVKNAHLFVDLLVPFVTVIFLRT